MFTHYCGLPVHSLKTTRPQHDKVLYVYDEAIASNTQFVDDTHWIDISDYHIFVNCYFSQTYSEIRPITQDTVLIYRSNCSHEHDTILAFKSEEDMNMTILKYPELFENAIFPIEESMT